MTQSRDTPPSMLGFAARHNLRLQKSITAFASLFPACYLQGTLQPKRVDAQSGRAPAPCASAPTDALPLSLIWNRPSLWSRESQREQVEDVAIAWAYLIAAGLCEVGWPIGLKWTQEPGWTVLGTAMAVISLAISDSLLFLAQRDISLGTSYAVWTGIGAAGTFLVGVWFFGDPSSFGRWLGASLIIAGVITLKLAH
jgi:quaternary ammonium compound-resistance protein SugE